MSDQENTNRYNKMLKAVCIKTLKNDIFCILVGSAISILVIPIMMKLGDAIGKFILWYYRDFWGI